MIIEIENRLYLVNEEGVNTVFDKIEQFTLEQYSKLPEFIRLGGQAATRALLAYAEAHEKDPEKRKLFRPPERKDPARKTYDPTVHLLHFLVTSIKEGLMHVEANVATDDNRIITAVSLQSASRGHLLVDGDTGKRQDDGGEAHRQYVVESLSLP